MSGKIKSFVKKNWWFGLFGAVITVACVGCIVIGTTTVSGNSMNPTYSDGDTLFMYKFGTPKRGDVIVCQNPRNGKVLIKRVIGIEGDKIEIDYEKGIVKVNGLVIDEPYIQGRTVFCSDGESVEYPYIVSEGCYFVMGDNREASDDSRLVGEVKNIYGIVIGGRKEYDEDVPCMTLKFLSIFFKKPLDKCVHKWYNRDRKLRGATAYYYIQRRVGDERDTISETVCLHR